MTVAVWRNMASGSHGHHRAHSPSHQGLAPVRFDTPPRSEWRGCVFASHRTPSACLQSHAAGEGPRSRSRFDQGRRCTDRPNLLLSLCRRLRSNWKPHPRCRTPSLSQRLRSGPASIFSRVTEDPSLSPVACLPAHTVISAADQSVSPPAPNRRIRRAFTRIAL